MVTVLEGKGRFTVGDEVFYVEEGETLIMPQDDTYCCISGMEYLSQVEWKNR